MDSKKNTNVNSQTYVAGSHQPTATCLCGECRLDMEQTDIEEILAILAEEGDESE